MAAVFHKVITCRLASDPEDQSRVLVSLKDDEGAEIYILGDLEAPEAAVERRERVRDHLLNIFAELGYAGPKTDPDAN